MAATFVVEDGSGKADANAYTSVENADQYHENYGNPAAWSGLSTAEKQEAIREATRYMDALYFGRWRGTATNRLQRLAWPRTDVDKRDGFYYDPNEIPPELEDACAALALEHENSTTGLLPSLAAGSGSVKAERNKVGPIESETEYLGATRERVEFPLIDGILAPLLKGGGGVGVMSRG